MAEDGNFTYVPVKDFYLLEFVFLTLALKVTNSLSLSVNQLAVNNVTATWAEVRQQRHLSNVALDYALLIDISYSMSDRITGPAPKCFAGHDLKKEYLLEWNCDICGKDFQGSVSLLFPFFFIFINNELQQHLRSTFILYLVDIQLLYLLQFYCMF